MNYKNLLIWQNDIIQLAKRYEIENITPEKVYKKEFKKTPVWIMWYQGFNNAPELVKMCVKSIQMHLPQDKVEIHFLTKDNLNQYIKLPNYLKTNIKDNVTALSNIIRAALLYNYGGLWIDATYLFIEDFSLDNILNKDFWAIREEYTSDNKELSFNNFTYNFMYSKPNNDMLKYIYKMLCNYWKHYNYLKHYFLKDGIIFYGYQNNCFSKKWIDNLNQEQTNMYSFCSDINNIYSDQELLKKRGNDYTICFKLSHRFYNLKEKQNNELTFYGYFKQKYLNKENKNE